MNHHIVEEASPAFVLVAELHCGGIEHVELVTSNSEVVWHEVCMHKMVAVRIDKLFVVHEKFASRRGHVTKFFERFEVVFRISDREDGTNFLQMFEGRGMEGFLGLESSQSHEELFLEGVGDEDFVLSNELRDEDQVTLRFSEIKFSREQDHFARESERGEDIAGFFLLSDLFLARFDLGNFYNHSLAVLGLPSQNKLVSLHEKTLAGDVWLLGIEAISETICYLCKSLELVCVHSGFIL